MCKRIKRASLFHNTALTGRGKNYWCKSCQKKYSEKYRNDKRAKVREANRQSHLKREYGLTAEAHKALLESHNNKCAICRADKDWGGRKYLSVDHDHKTGKVRGVLCNSCNVALGLLKDDPQRLRAAADYLDRFDSANS